MAGEGTIQSKGMTLSKFFESELLFLTLKAGDDLSEGQEVYLTGNNQVAPRVLGSQTPIGVVSVGALDTENATIATSFQRTLQAKAIGGTLSAGQLVKPNGNIGSDGRPEYVAAVAGDKALGIVLSGNTVNLEIRIGIFRTHITSFDDSANANGSFTSPALSTAALTAETINIADANIKAGSKLVGSIGGYSGTIGTDGMPVLVSLVATGDGTAVATIVNTHATNALDGTVTVNYDIN